MKQHVFRGNVAVISVTTAANVAAQMVWYPILPLIFRDLRATDFQVSLVYSLAVVLGAIGQLPGGILADRIGRKPIIALPTFVAAAAVLGAGWASSWGWLAVAVIVMNTASAVQTAGFVSMPAESVDPGREGEAFAYLELFASLGVGIGPLLGAVLLPVLPLRGLFAVSAAIMVASAVARTVLLKETHSAQLSLGGPEGRGQPAIAAGPEGPGAARAKRETRADRGGPARLSLGMLFSGPMLWLTLTAIVVMTGNNLTLYGPFVPLYAHDVVGLSKQQVDMLYCLGPLVAAASGLAMGRYVARRGGGRAIALGMAGMGLSLAGLLVVRSFWWALLAVSVAGIAMQLGFVGYDTLRAQAAPPEQRGRVVAMLGTTSNIVGAATLPLVGRLVGGLGLGLALAAGIACSALGVYVALRAAGQEGKAAGRRQVAA